jgi:hypothetical protein
MLHEAPGPKSPMWPTLFPRGTWPLLHCSAPPSRAVSYPPRPSRKGRQGSSMLALAHSSTSRRRQEGEACANAVSPGTPWPPATLFLSVSDVFRLVISVWFKCFRYFWDVARVWYGCCICYNGCTLCCKRLSIMFHLCFQTYVISVFI